MANYTILDEKDIEKINQHYGLTIHSFKAIEGGQGNSSYLLKTNQGNYVLTVFDNKEWTEVVHLGKLLNHLRRNDFDTTKLLPRRDGKYVTGFQDIPVMIKPFIRGSVIQNLSRKMIKRTGKRLAKLHLISAPDYLPLSHSYDQLFSEVIGSGIDPAYETWIAGQQRSIRQRLPEDSPMGLIHGDLFYDNVLFKGDELQAIIDFEEACHHYLSYDIGMAILGQCLDGEKIQLDKAKEFISGYQQIRILKQMEQKKLQLFVEYAAVATSCWRFWNYNIARPTPQKQKIYREMVRIAKHVQSIPTRDFKHALFGSI